RPERATLHARTTLAASRATFRGASRTARCDGAELMRERDLLRAPAGERGHAGLLRALHVPHLVDATAPGQVHPGREADDGAVAVPGVRSHLRRLEARAGGRGGTDHRIGALPRRWRVRGAAAHGARP